MTKRNQTIPMMAALALSLGGCQLTSQLQGIASTQFSVAAEPKDGARARLRVVATRGIVKAIPGRDCVDLHAPGAGTVVATGPLASQAYRGRSLGMPASSDVHGQAAAEFYVAAEQSVTLLYTGSTQEGAGYGRTYECARALTFTPRTDADYEAIFLPGSQCLATIRMLGTMQQLGQPARRCDKP